MKRMTGRVFLLILAVVLFILGFEGNGGKGLACFISPASLEVNIGGSNTQSGTSTNQASGATSST